jgi:prepilin peptidase CpaA
MNRVQIASYVVYTILGVALAISVVTDLRSRKILNVVTLPAAGMCLALRAAAGYSTGAAWGSLAGPGLAGGVLGLVIGGAAFLLPWLMGGMGGGDVKLMASVGAAVGFPTILACIIFIAVVGGIQAVVLLVWRGQLLSTFWGMFRGALQKTKLVKADPRPKAKTYFPYGIAIALGTVWGVWWTASQAALPVP